MNKNLELTSVELGPGSMTSLERFDDRFVALFHTTLTDEPRVASTDSTEPSVYRPLVLEGRATESFMLGHGASDDLALAGRLNVKELAGNALRETGNCDFHLVGEEETREDGSRKIARWILYFIDNFDSADPRQTQNAEIMQDKANGVASDSREALLEEDEDGRGLDVARVQAEEIIAYVYKERGTKVLQLVLTEESVKKGNEMLEARKDKKRFKENELGEVDLDDVLASLGSNDFDQEL